MEKLTNIVLVTPHPWSDDFIPQSPSDVRFEESLRKWEFN